MKLAFSVSCCVLCRARPAEILSQSRMSSGLTWKVDISWNVVFVSVYPDAADYFHKFQYRLIVFTIVWVWLKSIIYVIEPCIRILMEHVEYSRSQLSLTIIQSTYHLCNRSAGVEYWTHNLDSSQEQSNICTFSVSHQHERFLDKKLSLR